LTKAADFKVVANGSVACVRLSPEADGQYRNVLEGKDKLSVQRKTRLGRIFEEFCSSMHPRLNDEQFKKEGDYRDGNGKTVSVFAIKAWKFRLYGTLCTIGNKKCFVGVKVDAAKKQNKANPALLKATAKALGELDEFRA
jgi:hypothetical protein